MLSGENTEIQSQSQYLQYSVFLSEEVNIRAISRDHYLLSLEK